MLIGGVEMEDGGGGVRLVTDVRERRVEAHGYMCGQEETGSAGCQNQGGFSSGVSTPDPTGSCEGQLRCDCLDETRTFIRFNIQKMQHYLNQR